MRLRGLPIFWQTLLLLLASLVISQAVSVALLLALPPPRPDFNRLSDIAAALAGGKHERSGRERALRVETRAAPPAVGEDMVSDRRVTRRLADRIGVPPDAVVLFYEPDQRATFPFRRRGRDRDRDGDRNVIFRRGEPLFFNTVVAAVDTGAGWRVVRTPPRPLVSAWQKRLILWFGVSALVLLPFAWFFARRLTRPIQRFAEAADRMGADPGAPRVAEEGPAELRTTAHALNRMQQRVSDYLSERTAMIGAIAHDLRTPLARIAFRIEGAPDEVRDKVQADIEQMRAMIAATIGFVKGTARATEFAELDLAALLLGIVAEERDMDRPVESGVIAPVLVRGDRLALARLFQNLIDNAVTYGGKASVSLEVDGAMAEAIVADRGPGLPPDAIDRVFQPFERGEPSRSRETGGIGLGLTIARAIARDHGGAVILRNRDGGGLEAVARLPLA